MRIEDDVALKQALSPEPVQVERVISVALAAKPREVHSGARWTLVGAALALIALVSTYVRRDPPFTEPLPVAAVGDVSSKVSNFGSVMLVEVGSGPTLVANSGLKPESAVQQHSYRIIISKGATP